MSEKYKKTSKEKYLKRQHKYYEDLAKKIKQKLIPILKITCRLMVKDHFWLNQIKQNY